VQYFPRIKNVACDFPQHSAMFGQDPSWQIVFSLYLSRVSLICFPESAFGNGILNQSGRRFVFFIIIQDVGFGFKSLFCFSAVLKVLDSDMDLISN